MTPRLFLEIAIEPALTILPPLMNDIRAKAMILAVCLQESELRARRQMPSGPARSYAQFEPIGVAGVLAHPMTRQHVHSVCQLLDVKADLGAIHHAIEYHDVLCAALSRLLLWTLPVALPRDTDVDRAWTQYLSAWRPGKPRPADWPKNFADAWGVVREAL
jgi:hypothetical protein